MDLRSIIVICMGIALFFWVLFCAIQLVRQSKKITVTSDFTAHVRCEKCNFEYDVNTADFNKSYRTKYVKSTKSEVSNGMIINVPHYSYYAKKLVCPCCNKKAYAKVLNIDEIQQKTRKPVAINCLKWMIVMFVGGMLIVMLTSIPMRLADNYAKKQVEDMKQEHYEEIKDKYIKK